MDNIIKMEHYLTICIIFICIIFICIIYYFRINNKSSYPTSYNILDKTDKTDKTDEIDISVISRDILNKNNIYKSESDNYDICFINNYDEAESKLKHIKNECKYIYGIKGMDYLAGKNNLWAILVNSMGKTGVKRLLPETWLMSDDPDIVHKLFLNENRHINPETIFIIKKNIQRQQGLKLVRKKQLTKDYIIDLKKQDYVIIQKYLKGPLIIDKRKVNFRIYLLIVITDGIFGKNIKCYMYNDGFMYYTKSDYIYNTKIENSITTGYLPREVYIKNPLTLNDLRVYLGVEKSEILFNNIFMNLSEIMSNTKYVLKNNENKINFQLFGVDYQSDTDLNVKLIEINKSPDLTSKDKRDGDLKYALQKDIFKLVGIIKDTDTISNNFRELK